MSTPVVLNRKSLSRLVAPGSNSLMEIEFALAEAEKLQNECECNHFCTSYGDHAYMMIDRTTVMLFREENSQKWMFNSIGGLLLAMDHVLISGGEIPPSVWLTPILPFGKNIVQELGKHHADDCVNLSQRQPTIVKKMYSFFNVKSSLI